MTARALLLPFALMAALLFACVKPINDGNACFQTSECQGGSVCAGTVDGKYCMKKCSPDVVRCNNGEACLQSEELPPDVDGGTDAGTDPDAGTDTDAGADTDAGTDTDAGAEDEIWVCLPGRLENPNFISRVIGQVCDYSLDCVTGGVCVCIPGAICEGQGKNGPTCEELCNPNVINQCPRGLACTDLGTGRGFCDPSTFVPN